MIKFKHVAKILYHEKSIVGKNLNVAENSHENEHQ
jgi:hypothetical protein